MRLLAILTFALFCATQLPAAAVAQTADPCTGHLSSQQILGCLNKPPKSRGFPVKSRGISAQGQQAEPEQTSVNLMVNFDFNSAQLTNDGMISLDALGKALSDPSLKGARFQIAGHTDAVGGDDYNQKLSQSRAHSVADYLAAHYQLPGSEFDVVGYGKTQLYDKDNPTGAINRRVQVTKLGG
jgi:outer membrane protein OmpA-like peptidoglycan-associated protein